MRLYHMIAHLRLGAGRYVTDLAIEQSRKGYAVSVCLSEDQEGNWKSDRSLIDELRRAGVTVVRSGNFFHRTVEGLHAAAQSLRIYSGSWIKGGVVHAHTAMGAVVARWSGAPTVVSTCHGWNLSRPQEYDVQDAIAFFTCDTILSPSSYWADLVARLAGRSDVKVQPLGFDLSRYPQSQEGIETDRSGKRIVCVAELTARKGQDVLIDAMPWVWEAYPETEVCFMGNGDAEAELLAHAKAVDPDGRKISFRGFVENPFLALRQFDVMCLPAFSDNQPVAIIEAMLAGLPVVSTQVGGIPELLSMGQFGDCVAPGDARALAGMLVQWLSRPPGEIRLRSENARQRARELFNIQRHAQKMESLYGDAIRKAHSDESASHSAARSR